MKNSPQVTAAFNAVLDQILSFTLAPGALVSDSALAAALQMSRAPVREAMLLLTTEGLVTTADNGKTYVSPIGLSDVADILNVRRALEAQAVKIIAARGWLSKEQERQLTAVFEDFSRAVEADASASVYRYDALFHSTIIGFSGSERIRQIIDRMNLQMQRARWLNIAMPQRKAESKTEHEEILSALLARDCPLCAAKIEAHLTNSENGFRAVFNDPNLKQTMAGIYNFYRD